MAGARALVGRARFCRVRNICSRGGVGELGSPVSPAMEYAMPAKEKDKGLNELFLDTLKDIYFAEKQILRTLPKMAKAASSDKLRAAFEKHQSETEDQVE